MPPPSDGLPPTYLGLGSGKGMRGGPVVNPAKGALVSVSPLPPGTPTVIRFQYNPDKLTRTLSPDFYKSNPKSPGRAAEARFNGAPGETIDLTARLDATEGLAAGDPRSQTDGIRPELAALELLAYPTLDAVQQDEARLKDGTVGVVALMAPQVLLIFGMSRIVPVKITTITVTEDFFHSNLAPIRASVALKMEVVSYSRVYPSNPNYKAHIAYQRILERKAKIYFERNAEADVNKYASAAKGVLG